MVEVPAAPVVESSGEEDFYRCLVVDAGPIIKLSGISALWKKAQSFYTVPGVIQEIRDAKARHHLNNLPFDIAVKDPSPEAIQTIIKFSRQTGDYQSLSLVDIQVLALVYDLEKEGCHGDVSHLRKEPKRTVGVGKLHLLAKDNKASALDEALTEFSGNPADVSDGDESDSGSEELAPEHARQISCALEENVEKQKAPKPASWAALLDPNCVPFPKDQETSRVSCIPVSIAQDKPSTSGGQFDNADEDCDEPGPAPVEYIGDEAIVENKEPIIDVELEREYPRLSASVTVPVGDEGQNSILDDDMVKRRSQQTHRKPGKLLSTPAPVTKSLANRIVRPTNDSTLGPLQQSSELHTESVGEKPKQSRIMGGMTDAGQQDDVEDDGEGWISTASEIRTLKAIGALSPDKTKCGVDLGRRAPDGPPLSQRTACTTTDFAMQNVLLQMNMELLSVDGMKIRKVKAWVRRCGACYTVYTDSQDTGPLSGKRLFCDKCGSDMIQRIACSVDGKTGRLRLHLKKNYQFNLRGTKFSLPKPGRGDRFKGDLLLREDQLLTGTWGQKAKMCGGGKAKAPSESIFGRDIATNVGCHVSAMNGYDIQVGFGRRNPNAAKGRERRGKKKKSPSTACGLRRY